MVLSSAVGSPPPPDGGFTLLNCGGSQTCGVDWVSPVGLTPLSTNATQRLLLLWKRTRAIAFCLTDMLRAFWNRPERSPMPPRKRAEVSTLLTVGMEIAATVTMIATTTSSSTVEKPS